MKIIGMNKYLLFSGEIIMNNFRIEIIANLIFLLEITKTKKLTQIEVDSYLNELWC